MIIRYGYYFDRTNRLEDPVHVNVFAFSRDVETGMVLFGHSFYKGNIAEYADFRSRLRMTAVNRLIRKPIVAYLPKGDELDNFCKNEDIQKKIQPHMSFDGSLSFKTTETVFKHYRPYAIVYLMLQILRSKSYKDNNVVLKEMVSSKEDGINVSNVKFIITQMWNNSISKLIDIPFENGIKDPYKNWSTENYNSLFKMTSKNYKNVDTMMEGHYLNTQIFKGTTKTHFSEVNSFTQEELSKLGLFGKPITNSRILAKNIVPKGIHIFRWNVTPETTIFISFLPDIQKGTLEYNYFIADADFKESRYRDWRRLGNHIAMKRLFKNPLYIVCEAENSIERRNAIKKRIFNHYRYGKPLNVTVAGSFRSFIFYPVEKLVDWIISMV